MSSLPADIAGQPRLFIVANRLPVTIRYTSKDEYCFESSSGGVATLLKGLAKDHPMRWYGWVGDAVPTAGRETVAQQLESQFGAFPVFLGKELSEKFYEGFSSTSKVFLKGSFRYSLIDRLNAVAFVPL